MQTMTNLTHELNDLKQKINQVFGSNEYPGDNKIVKMEWVLEPSDEYYIFTFFKGKKWQEITLENLMEYPGDIRASLILMRPEGFCYYLPSYLLTTLQILSDTTLDDPYDIVGTTLFSLTKPSPYIDNSNPPAKKYIVDSFSDFSTTQREVIISYLKFIQKYSSDDFTRENAEKALNNYWEV